ncbi:MAG: hypothetical protein G01um101419_179 [Parcubacteria group bacterium Gr01-1014_19]|nr:MAG: hypothetical protein G01um101419_179 [Parcubacteria group bacterium Gr01-1014_19]
MKYFINTVITIVTAAIVAGFFIVGSPKDARLFEQDEQRLANLQFIQSEILNYWMNKARLPKTLADLKDDLRGIQIPKDPETGADYRYTVKGAESFQLCATFAKASLSTQSSGAKPYYPEIYGQESWKHDSGEVCFDRKIDKELYKPIKPVPVR